MTTLCILLSLISLCFSFYALWRVEGQNDVCSRMLEIQIKQTRSIKFAHDRIEGLDRVMVHRIAAITDRTI